LRLRNVLTVALLAVFGSMTLFGAVTYASDGLNPFHQQPIDAPPQVHQPSAIKADEPKSLPVPTMDPTPAVHEPTESKADPASKPKDGHPKAEQPISEPVVDPKPVDEPVKPKKSDQDQADEPVKPKQSEQAQREKDSETGEKEELVTVSLAEDQPVSKQEIGKSNQANLEPKEDVAAEPVVADNSQEQASASESSSHQEEEADDQPKTANGGKMEQTGSETVSLLLISIGVLGMGATLTVRYGWKGA